MPALSPSPSLSSSPSASPSPAHLTPSSLTPHLHTYHCLCSTLLLCTPYSLKNLPTRASPSLDKARILPLPPLRHHRSTSLSPSSAAAAKPRPTPASGPAPALATLPEDDDDEEAGEADTEEKERKEPEPEKEYLPSLLLPALRPARKLLVVRRQDGYERRRVWRCGRCGLGVGYEVEGEAREGGGEGKGREKEKMRVMFLLEGGLVETEQLGVEAEDGGVGIGVEGGAVMEGVVEEEGEGGKD